MDWYPYLSMLDTKLVLSMHGRQELPAWKASWLGKRAKGSKVLLYSPCSYQGIIDDKWQIVMTQYIIWSASRPELTLYMIVYCFYIISKLHSLLLELGCDTATIGRWVGAHANLPAASAWMSRFALLLQLKVLHSYWHQICSWLVFKLWTKDWQLTSYNVRHCQSNDNHPMSILIKLSN